MVPETPITDVACARPAPPTSSSMGFSADSLGTRRAEGAKALVIQNEGWRKGQPAAVQGDRRRVVAMAPSVEHVLDLHRTDGDVLMNDGRDARWHDLVGRQLDGQPAEIVDAEHML